MNQPHVREAVAEDAAALIALVRRLYAETEFLLYEPGEFVPPIVEYARRIHETSLREDGVMFLVEANNARVGVLFGNRGGARKTRHSLFLVMGLLKSHWHQGIGTALLRAVEQWAAEHGVHRLELTVQTTNIRAIALYQRAGFQHEGTKRHSLRVQGQNTDEWLMSKLLDA
jgi:RimJ/RimL family protein N-acetyltransferase